MLKIINSLLLLTVAVTSKTIYINQSSPLATNDDSCWSGGELTPCLTFNVGIEGLWNVSVTEPSSLIVVEGSYIFNAKVLGKFHGVDSINIQGIAINNSSIAIPVNVSCSEGVGLSFINSTNITISGISFNHCSGLQASTSINTTNNFFVATGMHASLCFLYCTDIQLLNVAIQNTNGKGVILYNLMGISNIIQNCDFVNNKLSDRSTSSGGGGLLIEYSVCTPGYEADCIATPSNDDPTYVKNVQILIAKSNFVFNRARISKDQLLPPKRLDQSIFGSGGGISILFRGNLNHNTITIVNCMFKENHAVWGGGLFIRFEDTKDNTVEILSSHFVRNVAFHSDFFDTVVGGGGSRVEFNSVSGSLSGNNIFFKNTMFDDNAAYYGGGLSFFNDAGQTMNLSLNPNTFTLFGCQFDGNSAHFGSGIDFTTKRLLVPNQDITVHIENCSFTNNLPSINKQTVGAGAIYVDATHVLMNGFVTFAHNKGSALVASGSTITFNEYCTSIFSQNTGRNGAAISLLGNSLINIGRNASFSFSNNSADHNGGAIYFQVISEHDTIPCNCFLQYYNTSIPPDNWTVRFEFSGNLANGKINSIYSSTLLPCICMDRYFNLKVSDNILNVFCWNAYSLNWVYDAHSDKQHCSNHISSAPSAFLSNNNSEYAAIPGQSPIKLNLTTADDYGFPVTNPNVFMVDQISGNALLNENNHFITNNDIYISGKENTTVRIRVETLDPIIVQTYILINFKICPPGFVLSSTSCTCAGTYSGYVFCNEETYTAEISRSAWIGSITDDATDLVVGLSPYVFSGYSNERVQLPSAVSEIDDLLCGSNKRKGVLCGECTNGYGVAVNTNSYECVRCTKQNGYVNWLLYILTEFIPVSIFFILIFLFSSVIALGPLNSFIFFAQIIFTVVKIDAEGMVPLHQRISNYKSLESVYIVLYEIWNLNFFRSVLPGFCVGTAIKTLDVYALKYLTAVFPLLLLILFIINVFFYNRGVKFFVIIFHPLHLCLARLSKFTKLRQSIPGGIAVFILVSYTKFTLVSFDFFAYFPLYNAAGDVVENVFYYDGSVLFPNEGWKYIIVACFFLCTFVVIPPFLLVYPSALRLLEVVSKNGFNFGKYYPNLKLQAFLDEFHGCYKDGSEGGIDCRWFSSLYFCLRIALFMTYTQSNFWHLQYLIQLLIFLVVALMFAFIRPYHRDWINNLDTAMFINLAAITAISQYNLQQARFGEDVDLIAFSLQFVLVLSPLIYCIGYLSRRLMKAIYKNRQLLMKKRTEITNPSPKHESDFLDHLDNAVEMRSSTADNQLDVPI